MRAGAAEVLDSRIPPLDKLRLAQDVLDEVDRAKEDGKLPNVATVFEDRPDDEEYALFTPRSRISSTARSPMRSRPVPPRRGARARRARSGRVSRGESL